MLVKNPELLRDFRRDISSILFDKRGKVIERGSFFNVLEDGAKVTDIDVMQIVKADGDIHRKIMGMLSNMGKFTFINLFCGMYKEFSLPWEIDHRGSCIFSLEKARDWIGMMGEKNLLPEEVQSGLYSLFHGETLSLVDLLEVKEVIRPYSEIIWSKDDIKAGGKIVRGIKYTIQGEIQTGALCIAKFLYKHGSDYAGIDFSLNDFRYLKDMSGLFNYYRDNSYKIFKSLKKLIPKGDRTHLSLYYRGYLNNLNSYSSRISRISLVKTLEEAKNPEEFGNITETMKSELLLGSGFDNLKDLEKSLKKDLFEQSVIYINKIFPLLSVYGQEEITFFRERAKQAFKSVLLSDLEQSEEACPFFPMSYPLLKYLIKLSERLGIEVNTMISCVSQVFKHTVVSLDRFLDIFPNNNLYVIITEKKVFLMERGKEVDSGDVSRLKEFQRRVINPRVKNLN